MNLQTQLSFKPSQSQFGYEDSLLLLGSCFSENIGKKLSYHKFQSTTNPFGIIFNPIAVERLIEDAILDKTYTEEDVFELDGIWKSFYAHSTKNALSRLGAVIHLQEAQQLLREQLLKASHLILTLGTAWVYRHKSSGEIVANCHKVPQKEFSNALLSISDITSSLSKVLELIKKFNSKITIVFTVSPVRHIKDGFIENTRSKAHLLSSVHQLTNDSDITYFPSYELMMDELRDYRFYKSDMLHPSEQAVDYIWEKFISSYAFAKAQQTLKEVEIIQKGLSHRPFNPDSDQHNHFIAQLKKRIATLQKKHSHINF